MKNGFTMVELIITIGLITILGLVIVMNMGSNLSSKQEAQYEEFKHTLENAACVYIDLSVAKTLKQNCKTSGSCQVAVSSLLSQGLIEESDLKDPTSGESIPNNKNIKITYTNGKKECKYVE